VLERFAPGGLDVLRRFGVAQARRALPIDPTEEVILLRRADYDRVDVEGLTRALMEVFPHTKVWVASDGPKWASAEDI
jgi:hypothetical protein